MEQLFWSFAGGAALLHCLEDHSSLEDPRCLGEVFFDSPNMEMERWVMMKTKNKNMKAPSVRIAMKIEAPNGVGLVERKRKNKWDESCGCCHGDFCNSACIDSELFVIGAALDAF